MFKNIIRVLGGDPNRREVERLAEIVNQVNALEPEFEALSDEALSAKTVQFRQQIADAVEGIRNDAERYQAEQTVLEEILPEAFAAVREASKRTIGLRHYDVQLIGGMTLHNGKIAEMRTGEGKTLVATLALYLNALSGRGTHLVTVNDYLARRDARWMAPIYHMLGLSVGVLQMASRTENGRNAFLVDFDRKSPHEDQHQLRMVPRREAYLADITYGTNSEFGFDYLRDNTTMRLEDRSQRGHHYAIIDEVDNILIDEARTPLIISGPASEDVEWYYRAAQVVKQLRPEDYEISEKDRQVTLTELGEAHVEQLLEMPLRDPERPEDITPEQARILGYLEQALRAQFLYRRNKEYLVQAGKVVIVDEFTGRLMPGRRWSDGLHQAVEAKEGVKVEAENVTYATITLQNYFRMYTKLAGMTGTALTEAEEFAKIYKLDVLPIPTNLEFQAMKKGGALVALEDRDEERYKYTYYARSDDPAKTPIYFKRKDYPDVVYRTEEAKLRAITQEIVRYYILGRPQLVGTTSVEHSDRLSNRLRPELLRRLMQTVIIRDAWMTKHHIEINERAIPELQLLYTPLESLNVADMRPLARQLDLSMNPEDDRNVDALMRLFVLAEADRPVLLQVLQAGIPHQVLNARKHDEESKIIARAGAFRAVTIATNMAGRGVDIKLGGELPDEIYQDVHRVLGAESYEMTLDERYDALKRMDEVEYGIYEEGVRAFLQYVEEMRKVRELGGLHVIGSERHEARRIDNQLRGRSARQGDPGSSRFYLSLEDDLMRMFGGEQAEGLLKRFNVDEAVPMEVALVGRLIEQSQTRVEGANFDIRKHLLEYDDVLNSQRKRIYEQRDRIFLKDDLAEDVSEMLHTDLQARIRPALEDEEGPWKLLAYLDEVQPPFDAGGTLFPSFTLQVLLADLLKKLEGGKAGRDWVEVLSDVARQALQAESDHILKSTKGLLEKAEESYEAQVEERMEAVDTFFEGLRDREDDLANRRYTALNEELSSLVRFTVRLNAEQWEQAAEKPAAAVRQMRDQLEAAQIELTLRRLFLTLDTRLEESLGLKPADFAEAGWGEIHAAVLEAAEKILNRRMERLVGAGGQIRRDLEAALEKTGANQALSESQMTTLLLMMLQGTRQVFDQKTHRRTFQRTTRLRYNYLAARLLEERPAQEVTDEVLAHLERAREFLMRAYGAGEFMRLQQLGATLTALDEITRAKMEDALGEALFIELAAKPFAEIPTEHQPRIMETLGRRIQTEIYRQLLLGVISELWVDYLTRVEALRVSIGLEAYAQRDPLVMYKGRASEMFTELLANIRTGVVSRMFTVRPRAGALAQLEQARGEASPSTPAVAAEEEATPGRAAAQSQPGTTGIQPTSGGKKKRKRH